MGKRIWRRTGRWCRMIDSARRSEDDEQGVGRMMKRRKGVKGSRG